MIQELEGPEDGGLERELPVEALKPSAFQPRRSIGREGIEELAKSIREHGVVQPILVRPAQEGFEIVAGERRWRAALAAGLGTVPAIVRVLSDSKALEIALVENVQREDLSPIEQARAYKKLSEELGLTQEMVAERVGKSRAHIANIVRLLDLDEAVQEMVADGRISFGHARALLGLEDRRRQASLAEEIAREGLSVRQAEERVRGEAAKRPSGTASRAVRTREPFLDSLEASLRAVLGTRVRISPGKRKGRIEIEYYGEDDLERIAGIIGGADAVE